MHAGLLVPLVLHYSGQAASVDSRKTFPLPVMGGLDGTVADLGEARLGPSSRQILAKSGIRWVRRSVRWSSDDRKRGQYDFSQLDLDFQQFRTLSVRPIVTIVSDPVAINPALSGELPSMEATKRFARAILRRYQNRGVLWQWDDSGDRSEIGTQDDLGARRAIGEIIRKEYPQEWMVSPLFEIDDYKAIERFCEAGLMKQYDAIALSVRASETTDSAQERFIRVKALLALHDCQRLPLWMNVQDDRLLDAHATPSAVSWLRNWLRRVDYTVGLTNLSLQTLREAQKTAEGREWFEQLRALSGFRYKARLLTEDPKDVVIVASRGSRPMVITYRAGATTSFRLGAQVVELKTGLSVLRPERRLPSLDLIANLPTIPKSVVFRDRAEILRLLRSIIESVPRGTSVEFELDIPVLGRKRLKVSGQDAELASKLQRFIVYLPHSDSTFPLSIRIAQNNAIIDIRTVFMSVRAFDVVRIPGSVEEATSEVSSIRGNFRGSIKLVSTEPIAPVPVELRTGESSTITFPRKAVTNAYLSFEESGRPLWLTGIPEMRHLDYRVSKWKTENAESNGQELPFQRAYGEKGDVYSVAYALTPSAPQVFSELAEPVRLDVGATHLGLWVFGDGSGVRLSMKLRDASGNTYQPEYQSISFKGWRYLQFPIYPWGQRSSGGGSDGIPAHPITLVSPYVIRSSQRDHVEGSLQVGLHYVVIQREQRLE